MKYPPRRSGCALMIFRGDTPDLPGWDDLGLVEVICHIDDTERTCFNRMRAEACRMGGDVVYHLPRKIWRPKDQAMGFRAKVAHTRRATAKEEVHSDADSSLPPPASEEEAAGPVIPLTGPGSPAAASAAAAAAAVPRDAGSAPPDARSAAGDARPRQ